MHVHPSTKIQQLKQTRLYTRVNILANGLKETVESNKKTSSIFKSSSITLTIIEVSTTNGRNFKMEEYLFLYRKVEEYTLCSV